ncbi:MAG: DUF1732 domain-containing protein, partial [Candidatus Heimdallarchaeota archaeon]|nr:DUF1732 domain-containing protein [Candidatus Heimdallarchaeota archaeon]
NLKKLENNINKIKKSKPKINQMENGKEDIDEELSLAAFYLDKLDKNFQSKQVTPKGKSIDFLTQEILRELNAASSKTKKKTAALLIGSNDFSQLTKPDAGRNTITTILNLSLHDYNGTYFLDIFGTRFLWKLVRKIVTLLNEIGNEVIKPEVINDILSGQKAIPSGIQPAPPENLVLVETIGPFKMKTSKYAIRMIRKQLSEQLEQFRRSIRTVDNVIDYFSEPRMTSQHSAKSRNRLDSSD